MPDAMKLEQHLEIRAPLDRLEQEAVRRGLASPDEIGREVEAGLRYVLSFARMTVVRNRDGQDVEVAGFLAPHAWRVRNALEPQLKPGGDKGLWEAVRELPTLVAATREQRRALLERFPLDRESLEAEVCERKLVLAAGGGGGAGYGYVGAYLLFHRNNLDPALIAGTSMGAIIGLCRARRRRFDVAATFEIGKRLTWQNLFRVLQSGSQYGLPAGLRLNLHAVLGPLFLNDQGEPLTLRELPVPMRIVTTGIKLDALKHDLSYYEHFLDDSLTPGFDLARGRLQRVAQVGHLIRELTEDPELLTEIVFGAYAATLDADVLDAAGFSSAIPALIHYDVLREDPRMRDLLDRLYAQHGIARMAEGGLVNNVPARVAYQAVMEGALGRRGAYVVAMDCFAPQVRELMFYPLQQYVRANVSRNLPYANLYFPLKRVLNALNLAPTVRSVEKAIRWTSEELRPHLPLIKAMVAPLPILPDR
ncbi:MAG: patatin-like phospholipase family protein [Pseudomonadota bacterium]